MRSRDDVEAEEVVNNPGGAANDPGEAFDLIRHYFDRKFDSLKTEIIAETHLAEESSRRARMLEKFGIRNASELAYQAELGSRSKMIYKLAYQAELGN